MLQNARYHPNDIKAEESTILAELEEVNKNFEETLLENAYFNSFRDHMLGQPILGSRENISNVN